MAVRFPADGRYRYSERNADGSPLTIEDVTATILFDMDGVFLEGPGTDPSVYERAADAALDELEVEPTAEQRAALRNYGYTDAVADHCDALGIDTDEFWRRKEHHASRFAHDRLRSGERGTYDDIETIRPLARNASLALVSNNRHETVEFVVEWLDFDDVFDAVRGRDPTPAGYGRRKPRPDYLEETLDKLGADEGLYVGDRDEDVLAAERAGLDSVYLRRAHNRNDPLPEGASYELASLAALSDVLADRSDG